jgi:hypothetical protein
MIEKCYALGDIMADTNTNGRSFTGGISGQQGMVQYCAALNQNLYGPEVAQNMFYGSAVSRIGDSIGMALLNDNVAQNEMFLTGRDMEYEPIDDDRDSRDGLGLSRADLQRPEIPGTSIYEKGHSDTELGLDWNFATVWKFSDDPDYSIPIFQWMNFVPEWNNSKLPN